MKPRYYVFDPTGNVTVLIEGERNKDVADMIMEDVPYAEQAGFLTDDGLTLTMTGGEFCGNAAMSAAALRYLKTGKTETTLKVSGAENPVTVTTVRTETGALRCTVDMPQISEITEETLILDGKELKLPYVRMQGIGHLIYKGKADRETAQIAIKEWCGKLSADALGIMFYDEQTSSVEPLVYTPGAGTLFWESSCASGTSALGVYLAREMGERITAEISEPGGILTVTADPDGKVSLTGKVRLM